MKLERILPFARTVLERAVHPGDIVVDATIGNGHDTLFLSNLIGEHGHVYGFDVQQDALEKTAKRLQEHSVYDRVTLFHASHEQFSAFVPPSLKGKVTGAIFNLGYLPGGDKDIVTTPDSTIKAIEQLIDWLAPEGVIVLVIYHGHAEGKVEKQALLQYVQQLDQTLVHVLQYQFINQQNNPPFIVAIEKR
ncbi:class I SAM-dependent methyltransferase [Metabacillus iocasae]|uniref:16S rRNA C1402 N4-methylase RsmH n=1 Tax=Priestia iocasae TaxID=2291674 RepID=A0ABS2QZD3_9BACI|nr:class I SAM-dependent methyltransferase [Metabacillus iocasae]MBM7704848.1 16S rRNA C1402 N4-methylase RsmH [Metabacillus iocasae]